MALYSLVYEVATGALIEIGPAGTDWGSGVHAPPAVAHREEPKVMRQEIAASRAKFRVVDGISADMPTFGALRLISKGQGGDGLTQTGAELAAKLLPAPDPAGKAVALTIIGGAMKAEAIGE